MLEFQYICFANCADSEKKETVNFAKNAFFPGITKYQISALMAKQWDCLFWKEYPEYLLKDVCLLSSNYYRSNIKYFIQILEDSYGVKSFE